METSASGGPHFRIRQMEIDDIPKVFHMGESLFEPESMPNLYRTWDEFEVVSLFLSDSELCLVAEIEKDIIGFALGTTVEKSRSAWKYGHLIWLGVEESYQHEHIAEKLFYRFRQLMIKEGVRMLIVDTQAENLPALKFFRKMGFGSPSQHIYLSMNLDSEIQQYKKRKKENG